ncbi:MAG: Tim44/TimA family putative adaptor protein [Alphaproteobacteria bacterium]|nr:Tim44/TimA family putative adaptor protein [Alphaproteobacteria bacterium]
MQVDLVTLISAVVAALLLGRLWAILGTRDDNDRQNNAAPPPPLRAPEPAGEPRTETISRLQPPGPPPHSLAGGLALVKTIIPAFEEKPFLREARDIFTSVVGAYASGRLALVSDLLSPALMESFQKAVNARAAAGQTARTQISRIREAEAVAARIDDKIAYVTVRFLSEQQNILRDAQGKIIGGTEGEFEEVTDTWTFAKDSQNPETKWIVVETRS